MSRDFYDLTHDGVTHVVESVVSRLIHDGQTYDLVRLNIKKISSCSCGCGSFTVSFIDSFVCQHHGTGKVQYILDDHETVTFLTDQSLRLHVQTAIASTPYAQSYVMPRPVQFRVPIPWSSLVPLQALHLHEILSATPSAELVRQKSRSVNHAISGLFISLTIMLAQLATGDFAARSWPSRRKVTPSPTPRTPAEDDTMEIPVIPIATPNSDSASALQALDHEVFLDEIAAPHRRS